MNILNRVAFFLFIGITALGCKDTGKEVLEKNSVAVSALITPEEVVKLKNGGGVIIVDVRGYDTYLQGHIPGAINISREALTDTTFAYSGIKAKRDQIQHLLRAKGIKNDDYLVLYDEGGSAAACRLWWILAHYGFNKTSILHGGLKSWESSGLATVQDVPKMEFSEFTFDPTANENLWVSKEELLTLVRNPNTKFVLLDVRSPEEYSGSLRRAGNKRTGHIPGSRNINWSLAMDSEDPTVFLSPSRLQQVFGQDLNKEADTIVVYCQSGVRSSHTTFVLSRLLGFKNVMNYEGSWSEWSYFEELPIITTVENQ